MYVLVKYVITLNKFCFTAARLNGATAAATVVIIKAKSFVVSVYASLRNDNGRSLRTLSSV